eukprot:541521_1
MFVDAWPKEKHPRGPRLNHFLTMIRKKQEIALLLTRTLAKLKRKQRLQNHQNRNPLLMMKLNRTNQENAPSVATTTIAVNIQKDTEDITQKGFVTLWLKIIWKMRSVYSSLAVHSFDVLTDVLVILQWMKTPNE